tara:strand:- start:679 stop:888 length:210 start_codon:yes stop_codon:yes gene_type:complete
MINELLILGGYGLYVWPAFIFTLGSCIALYSKIVLEYSKQEKMFLKEFNQNNVAKVKIEKEALSANPIF